MCGFLGVLSPTPLTSELLSSYRGQSQKLATRGTSDSAEKITHEIAFFHYRLAFRDIAQGQQPMSSAGLTLIYNGELYGYERLRKELSTQHNFCTKSDTEIIKR